MSPDTPWLVRAISESPVHHAERRGTLLNRLHQHMELDPEQIPASALYQHLIRTIVPRPIAWVSTMSPAGITNLAPFSFFTGAGSRPPSVVFCPSNRRDGSPKDTLRNIQETQEFVINVVPFRLAAAMNLSSSEVPDDESEFLLTGMTAAPSTTVKPPRVAESPVCFECRLMQLLPLETGPGGANVVVGRILHLHLDDAVLDADGNADPGLLDLIGRLGGASYCRTIDRFDQPRP